MNCHLVCVINVIFFVFESTLTGIFYLCYCVCGCVSANLPTSLPVVLMDKHILENNAFHSVKRNMNVKYKFFHYRMSCSFKEMHIFAF
jgi:hypothetical protein